MEKLVKALKGDLTEYTSIPFWAWNNELDEGELIRQIRGFKSLSIDGFILHARTGLKTEYLGEKWFDCIGACFAEARRSDMRVWVYDENGWPSGFVGGKLLKDGNYAQYVEYKGGKIAIKDHHSYADILNPDVVSQFIGRTHEEYYKRFPNSFGRELAGFFTDEPQYFRWATPFSRALPEAYRAEYGEDIFGGLPLLFSESAEAQRFRSRYYSLLNRLFTENFYKRIYDWCTAHNCELTGHSVEENSLSGQMWGCAGVMPSYEYEHIPGIDRLCRIIGDPIAPKQVGSVAEQLGKRGVLTETFASTGWDASPVTLRGIAEMQYVGGVNMMCQHLIPYSLRGQAKGDYPQFFSRHNTWIKDSKPFNDYFKRLSYILRNTRECADTLVIHPMRSAYLTYDRSRDYESVKPLETAFAALTERLAAANVQFHYGDETILRRHGKAEGGRLVVGKCSYANVIAPEFEGMDGATAALIEEFARGGGKLYTAENAPSEIKKAFSVRADKAESVMITHRKGAIGEFLYIFNRSETERASVAVGGPFRVLDLERAELRDSARTFTVEPLHSVIAVLGESVSVSPPAEKERVCTDVTGSFAFAGASDNNLTLDFVQISFDGQRYEPPVYVEAANERLIKEDYCGDLWLKYAFVAEAVPARARVLFETLDCRSFTLNGRELKRGPSGFDIFFEAADLTGLIERGENELIERVRYFQRPGVKETLYGEGVQESLKNCVIIDTEIAPMYIQGGFFVSAERKLAAPAPVPGTCKLQEKGFPNFAGEVTFTGEIDLAGGTEGQGAGSRMPAKTGEADAARGMGSGRALLTLRGRFMTAKVTVNGRVLPVLTLSRAADLSGCLKRGKNAVSITISASMRNMLGPHHCAAGDMPWVGHDAFDFRGAWHGAAAPNFTEKYGLVDFGLEKVLLTMY